MSPPQTPKKMATFLQVTPVAIDGSANAVQRTMNYSTIEHVRPSSAGEIAAFPTAATTIIYMEREGLNTRRRVLLTATAYATINTTLTT